MRGFMIVYQKSRARAQNFHNVSRHLPGLELFPACDGLNDFDAVKQMALRAGWVDPEYTSLREVVDYPAKLGVNCSHLGLLEMIQQESEWCLVLEDDVSWNGEPDAWQQLENIVLEAESIGVQWIHLAPPSKKLFEPENSIGPGLWRGFPGWGCTAYLLSPAQANWLLDQLPLNANIDHWYCGLAEKYPSSFATHKPVFTNLGAIDRGQRGTLLGSIIWSNREDGSY